MRGSQHHGRIALGALALLGASCLAGAAFAAPEYNPIQRTMENKTVTLTGHDLTIEQLIDIARHGAKVQLSPEAKKRGEDTFKLMNEGAAEGVAIYLFNRNPGAGREIVRFTGDPMSAENRAKLEGPVLQGWQRGPGGYGAEFSDEDVVRAIMLVRANTMTYLPSSPAMLQGVVDLLNNDITPVMRTRSGTGEAQGPSSSAINAALVGAGEVYYKGVRMPGAEALQKAGLKPVQPAPGDGTTGTVNSDVAGMAAILVADAQHGLEWADLIYAIDLNGMNSSVTPLFAPVQANRPYPWINWDAARVLDMMKGSYLFNDDKTRIIQDPESMRAGYVRQGAAWDEWAKLKDAILLQINYSDHNPAVKVDWSPSDSWELNTPQAMKYYIKGSAANGNQHGFVFSNANWDPYPIGNRVEAFTIAWANMAVAVMLRQERFQSTFFTVVRAQDILQTGGGPGGGGGGGGWANHEVWQRIQGLMNPVPPEGYSSDAEGVEELDAETLFKVPRAQQAVNETMMLLASDLVVGARWIDVRKKQDPNRQFGPAVTAAWEAFRKVSPLQPAAGTSPGQLALSFIKTTPVSTFYPNPPAMPALAGPSPLGKGVKSLNPK